MDALLDGPRPIVLDGAVGTELACRGVATDLPLWSAHAFATERGRAILQSIHEDYARAGAEILVTNTFRTTVRALGKAGRAGEWRSFNREAVRSARAGAAAAPGTRLVAGGLAPLEDCYRPDLVPEDDVCLSEHARQAELLAELGVDLILIETMNLAREARAALRAARATGLDVLLSLCPQRPCRLLSGEALEEVLPPLVQSALPRLRGVLVNCASPEILVDVFPRFLRIVPELPHGVYAHLGEPDEVRGWKLPERHEPERYARWIAGRVAQGARLVGGCCGTTPEHIAAISARIIGT